MQLWHPGDISGGCGIWCHKSFLLQDTSRAITALLSPRQGRLRQPRLWHPGGDAAHLPARRRTLRLVQAPELAMLWATLWCSCDAKSPGSHTRWLLAIPHPLTALPPLVKLRGGQMKLSPATTTPILPSFALPEFSWGRNGFPKPKLSALKCPKFQLTPCMPATAPYLRILSFPPLAPSVGSKPKPQSPGCQLRQPASQGRWKQLMGDSGWGGRLSPSHPEAAPKGSAPFCSRRNVQSLGYQ